MQPSAWQYLTGPRGIRSTEGGKHLSSKPFDALLECVHTLAEINDDIAHAPGFQLLQLADDVIRVACNQRTVKILGRLERAIRPPRRLTGPTPRAPPPR